MELESIYQANKQRSKVVREIQLESTPAAQLNKSHMEEGTLETLQCLLAIREGEHLELLDGGPTVC